MVLCELDNEVSGDILGWKLPAWQALLFHRVLPSCGGLIIYLMVICYDFALVYEHIHNGDEALAVFCLTLMVIPALLAMVFTLASPPPGLQTEDSACTITLQENDIIWILKQIGSVFVFPVVAIGRYCYLIFWWIEAVCSSRSQDDNRTREAILKAREPSPMELYLFLQAFIHSAPHAIINILDMMVNFENPSFDKINMQAVSLVVSSLRMASTATMYRRFEREKICGRKYPWNINIQNDDKIDSNSVEKHTNNEDNEPIYEQISKRESSVSNTTNRREDIVSDLIQFSPRHSEKNAMCYDDSPLDSDTSSDYLPPISRSDPLDSDDEYVRPISIIDRVAPRRRDTQFTIEKVYIPPPPSTPAPRPGSIAVWAERLVENAESIPTWLSAPPRRKHWEVIQDEPDLPRRVPRAYMRGLEPPDATAALVHFLGWYSFFIARLLSTAAFINFSPFLAIIILFSHYQVMLLFLIVPQASTVRRSFYIFLAFIYLFCLMEFKIRFRHVRVWHFFWIIVCTAEIVVFIFLWSTIDNRLHDWWRSYVVVVTIAGMILGYLLLLVYFIFLQPRETVVFLNKNKIAPSITN